MWKQCTQETVRILKSRSSFILAVLLVCFTAAAFTQTAFAPASDFNQTVRNIAWQLDNSCSTTKAELDAAKTHGTETDIQAKSIQLEAVNQQEEIWTSFEKDFQAYEQNQISSSELNTRWAQAMVRIELLWAFQCGLKDLGDPDLCLEYSQKLPWLNIELLDYQTFSEYQQADLDLREPRHLYFQNLKVEIERLLQELNTGTVQADFNPKGPGMFSRNYFALINLSGFLLPVVFIAFFLMNAIELHRSRSLFYSKTLPISSRKFFWIQVFSSFLAALIVFLTTFLFGFLLSGFCFGWQDLVTLVPVEPAVWKTGVSPSNLFASATMTEPFFSSTISGADYLPGTIQWLVCWKWCLIILGGQILLIFLDCLTVYSIAFLFRPNTSLFLCAIWIVLLCLQRFHFGWLNLLPLFWPSVVDLLYGGFGVGWGVWLAVAVIYAVLLMTLDFGLIGRKDVQ
ncbi:hypothetical protein [Allobaculum sp. JKK-2023]|uniref:hypothetical protein n=1 Tax=Allobaculum sp. JKK-2023 TaxID=3108943 RepID=UPI002B05FF2B|nr:hypothetical protein [Allobaculum sp. JKK-2023]